MLHTVYVRADCWHRRHIWYSFPRAPSPPEMPANISPALSETRGLTLWGAGEGRRRRKTRRREGRKEGVREEGEEQDIPTSIEENEKGRQRRDPKEKDYEEDKGEASKKRKSEREREEWEAKQPRTTVFPSITRDRMGGLLCSDTFSAEMQGYPTRKFLLLLPCLRADWSNFHPSIQHAFLRSALRPCHEGSCKESKKQQTLSRGPAS